MQGNLHINGGRLVCSIYHHFGHENEFAFLYNASETADEKLVDTRRHNMSNIHSITVP